MDFNAVGMTMYVRARFLSGDSRFPFPLNKPVPRFFITPSALLLLGLLPCSAALAAGDAARGRYNWEYTCQHCHGNPQSGNKPAFSDYDDTANKLSVYASDPGAITKAANEGYIVPDGNTNDKVEPGKSTNVPMGTWAGMAPNRLGLGTTPTQYAIDFSAYFASLFEVPGAPNIVSVSPGNAQASVNFAAPKSDLTITGYTVTASPGGTTVSGTASPIVVTGLVNGTKYTFTVAATSNAGTGKPSSSSNAVTLAAPIGPVATHGVAPASSPVVNAVAAGAVAPVKSVPVAAPAIHVVPAAPTPVHNPQTANVPPLSSPPKALVHTPATTGVVANSQAKVAVSPDSAPQATGLSAPVITFAKAGNAQARVFFNAPAGGAGITGYTVTVLSKGVSTGIRAAGTKSPITVSGLTNGTDYTFTISANSGSGTGMASPPSNSVTPLRILGD